MELRVVCPACTRGIKYTEKHAGKRVKCPSCFNAVDIPPLTPPGFDPLDELMDAEPASRAAYVLEPAAAPAKSVRKPGKGELVCAACGSLTKGRKRVKGSFFIEVLLWLFMILPGAIYTIWRLTTKARVCTECSSEELIPASSPRGRELLGKFHG